MNRLRLISCLPALMLLSACSTLTHFSHDNASGYRQWSREECVPYARRMSGINIHGDAWTWWNQANGQYARGNTPVPGAVLVLARTNKLPHGHLAVVTDLLGPRDINVTHTNWGNDWVSRRVTYESLHVQDISKGNDWTSVHFWNDEVGKYGFPYPAYGFIYKERPSPVYAPVATPAVMPEVRAIAPIINTTPRPHPIY